MKKLYLILFLLFSIPSIKSQTFIKKDNGLRIKNFYHQQNINYYIHTEDEKGNIYTILYDTVSSSFNYGKEYTRVRLRIYNGISWLTTAPIKLYNKNTIDAPRILDILYDAPSIYISGSFDSSENNLGAGIIKYNNGTWQRVSDNLLQTFPDYFEVNKLYLFEHKLLVTGNFDSITNRRVNGIAILNNGNWESIGIGQTAGFQNLSTTANVFFSGLGDSLYLFNKNKIKPDSIEIGATIIKKIGKLHNGIIEQLPIPKGNINSLGYFNKQLTAIITGNLIYTNTLGIYANGEWNYFELPTGDSFYSTNYVGQLEYSNQLYLFFQSPLAKIIVYKFDGSTISFYTEFKLSDNYLNLEFRVNQSAAFISGNFSTVSKTNYRDSVNKIVEIQFTPSTKIIGKCFKDDNGDGIFQSTESILSGIKVFDNNNQLLCVSDGSGNYNYITNININLSLSATNGLGLSNKNPIVLNGTKDSIYNIDIPLTSDNNNDIGVYMYSSTPGRAKQGFETRYLVEVSNSSDLDQNITLTVYHDKRVSNRQFINFNPLFKNSNQFSIILQLKAHSNQFLNFKVVYAVDSFQLGENVTCNAQVSVLDTKTENNRDTMFQTIVSAYDPNIKVASPSAVVSNQDQIKYVIYFENLGNDTALNVTVIDTFGSLLSLKDVIYGGTSHGNKAPSIGVNYLKWHFENINLPSKKTDSVNSWGFVSFRTRLNKQAQKGDTIYNKAAIYFDYQKPVITNKATVVFKKNNSIQTTIKTKIRLYPNPASTSIQIEFEQEREADLELYSSTGQYILSKRIKDRGVIDIPSNLSSGIYILKLKGDQEAIGTIVINQ